MVFGSSRIVGILLLPVYLLYAIAGCAFFTTDGERGIKANLKLKQERVCNIRINSTVTKNGILVVVWQ